MKWNQQQFYNIVTLYNLYNHDVWELVRLLHLRDTSGSSNATDSWRDFFEDLTTVKTTDLLWSQFWHTCTSFMHCLRTWCTVVLNFIKVDHRNSELWALKLVTLSHYNTTLLGWTDHWLFEDGRMIWRVILPGIGADGSESILSDWTRSIIRDFLKIFANHQQLLVSILLAVCCTLCPISKMVQA